MELQKYINTNDNFVSSLRKQNLTVIVNKTLNLALIKIKKNKEYVDSPWIKYCRGAVVDLTTNKLLCVPPMKSSVHNNMNEIIESYDEKNIYQPLIDGTMINMFHYNNEWIMSTRSNIGATNSWEGKRTFKDMFEEINGTGWFEELDKNHCYSFVVQHTNNRNVTPIDKNNIFLVESYNMVGDNIIFDEKLPQIEGITNIVTISESGLNDFTEDLYFSIKGITIKTVDSRINFINDNFKYVLSLKMNYNDKFMNYLDLCKKNKVEEHILYYPEDIELYESYSEIMNDIVIKTHSNYNNVHIRKTTELKDTPFPLIPLIRELHINYLDTKNKNTFKVISSYIWNLPYKRLLFIKNRL